MNYQTTTWNLRGALKTGASLIAGIAICTWLGGNASQHHHASPISVDSAASMAQQIAMPNAYRESLMAAPNIKGKLDLDMDQPGKTASDTKPEARQDDKLKAVKVRSAIFTLPVLKSGSSRSAHIQGVVS